jgi:hypothetical protein
VAVIKAALLSEAPHIGSEPLALAMESGAAGVEVSRPLFLIAAFEWHETVPIQHLNLRQRSGIHNVVLAD